jgi:voltage-gated potassium channel
MVVFIRVSESVIWLAFTIEFIVMVSIARNKLGYCRDHWIDIAIILLPFIAVLRVLRWSRLLRLHQVAKAGRVYRLRGLSTRMFRGILVLGVLHRFLQEDPEKQLEKLREKQTEREFELAQLRAEVADLEARTAEE